MKLVYTRALGARAARREGSSPFIPTKFMKVFRPSFKLDRFTDDVLASQLKLQENRVFANGTVANNHLDMAYDELASGLHLPLVRAGKDVIRIARVVPLVFVPVPNGANGYGDRFANATYSETQIELPQALKFIKKDRRVFEAKSETDQIISDLKAENEKIPCVVIDDASSDGGTGEALADHLVDDYDFDVVLCLSMFYRGNLDTLESKYDRGVVLAREIPLDLDWSAFREDGTVRALTS